MITKEQFLGLVMREVKIMKHLSTKILPGTLDYKPTEKQRTTLELLRYLSGATVAVLKYILSPDMKIFEEAKKATENMAAEEFPMAMDRQAEEIKRILMEEYTEEKLQGEVDLWNTGAKMSRSFHLIDFALEQMVAYRMQLFLYIKASGNTSIGTNNLWRGED